MRYKFLLIALTKKKLVKHHAVAKTQRNGTAHILLREHKIIICYDKQWHNIYYVKMFHILRTSNPNIIHIAMKNYHTYVYCFLYCL